MFNGGDLLDKYTEQNLRCDDHAALSQAVTSEEKQEAIDFTKNANGDFYCQASSETLGKIPVQLIDGKTKYILSEKFFTAGGPRY